MEQFSSKTVQEVVQCLKAENFSSQVIQAFEGKAILIFADTFCCGMKISFMPSSSTPVSLLLFRLLQFRLLSFRLLNVFTSIYSNKSYPTKILCYEIY